MTKTGCSTLNTTVFPASESTKTPHTEHRLASTTPITTMLDGVPTHQLVSVSVKILCEQCYSKNNLESCSKINEEKSFLFASIRKVTVSTEVFV